MIHAVPYLLPFVIPATIAVGYWYNGLGGFAMVFWIYLFVPWVDSLLGRTRSFRPEELPDASDGLHRVCRRLLQLWVPTHAAMLLGALLVVERHDLSPLQCWAIACSLGLAGGVVGFTVAHELAHSASRWESSLALVLAALFAYPHFCIEHVKGHHRYVGTPRDPATARLNETIYGFFIRSVFGGLRSAWQLEAERLRGKGFAAVGWRNMVLQGYALVATASCGIYLAFGWRGLAVFWAQSLVSVFLLEATNYVQHYGLVRREVAPGRYEPVSSLHSWNVEHRLTNWMLFNLGRHSEHHCEGRRSFEKLSSKVEGPVLPLGLVALVTLSFFPPIFQYVMNPRVLHWREINQRKRVIHE